MGRSHDAAKPKSIRRAKLTPKQAKFVKAKAEGKSGVQAALEAYDTTDVNTANQIAIDNLRKPTIAEAIETEYERQGITIGKIIEPFAEALKANRVVQVEGDFYETEVPDHTQRMTAGRTLAQFIGMGKEIAVSGGIHFHQHTQEKKQAYDD